MDGGKVLVKKKMNGMVVKKLKAKPWRLEQVVKDWEVLGSSLNKNKNLTITHTHKRKVKVNVTMVTKKLPKMQKFYL